MEEETKELKDSARGGIIPGVILIILGILFLLPRLGLDFGKLWPTFMLAPGLALAIFYAVSENKKKDAGIVIPATILILLSAFFYYMAVVSWQNIHLLWPVFPFVVGIALYLFYFLGGRKDKGSFISANILALVGIVFLVLNLLSYNFWPLILVVLGLIFILRSKKE